MIRGGLFSVIFPPTGILLAISEYFYIANQKEKIKTIKQKWKVIKKKKYMVNYKIFSGESNEKIFIFNNIYGNWKNEN